MKFQEVISILLNMEGKSFTNGELILSLQPDESDLDTVGPVMVISVLKDTGWCKIHPTSDLYDTEWEDVV